MAYVATHSGGTSKSRRTYVIRRRGGLGDAPVIDVSKIIGSVSPGSLDPVILLKVEMNRFAVAGAGKLQVFPAPLPVEGDGATTIDPETAGRAMALVNLRLLFSTVQNAATPDFQRVLDDADSSLADPVGWAKRNVAALGVMFTGIADANNLPDAIIPGQILTPTNLLFAAIGVGLLIFASRGNRRAKKGSTRRR